MHEFVTKAALISLDDLEYLWCSLFEKLLNLISKVDWAVTKKVHNLNENNTGNSNTQFSKFILNLR